MKSHYEQFLASWPKHVPVGYCQCKCGNKTSLAIRNIPRQKNFKGCPVPYLQGHATKGKHTARFGKEYVHPNIHPFKYLDGLPKYVEDPVTGCWNWVASMCSGGYGSSCYGHKQRDRAHRVSWRYHNNWKKIPKGYDIHHRCTNRRCVNPDHLELLSKTNHMRLSPNVKINLEVAIEIRKLYREGKLMRELAAMYSVHSAHISRIISHKVWKV